MPFSLTAADRWGRALAWAAAAAAGAAFAAIVAQRREAALKQRLQREIESREEERKGRIAAERQLRRAVQDAGSSQGYQMLPIGTVRSVFPDRRGVPRQPALCPSTRARLDISAHVPIAAFEDLENFSHVILLYVFHQNTNMHKGQGHAVKAKVKPPQLGGRRVGIFSTRTPHRANPLGLSVVRLERVDAASRCLHLSAVDLVDGTPLLDIKPYLPFDAVPTQQLRVPSWIQNNTDYVPRPVRFSKAAAEGVRRAIREEGLIWFPGDAERGGGGGDGDAAAADSFIRMAKEVLSLDIRAVHLGRGQSNGRPYQLRLDRLDCSFVTLEDAIVVQSASLAAEGGAQGSSSEADPDRRLALGLSAGHGEAGA